MEGVIGIMRVFIIFFTINLLIKLLIKMSIAKNQIFMKKDDEVLDNYKVYHENDLVENEISNKYKDGMEELVYDEICEMHLPKKEAYQLIEKEGPKYFSSWECREQYIKEKNM